MMLPNGWKKVRLGDCFDVQLGKMLNKNAREQEPQYPYLANVNVRWGSLNTEQLPTMFFSEREKEKFALKINDILMCEGGEIGRCTVLKEPLDNVFYQKACHRLRAKNNLCIPDYLYFYINNYVTSREIVGLVGESSIAHLPAEKVVQIQLNLPPLEEQKKIAATLSVWDSAIEKMEKFIDAKENELNIVLRQNLLEKGIALKWKEIPLTEILKSVTPPSKIHQDSYLNSGKYPIVDQSKDLIAGWTNDESSVLKINRPLIIFGDHTCALKIMHMPFAQGADGIKILSAKDGYDPTYIYYAIKANPVIPEGYKRHFSALMLKSILCPSLEEQKKYAVYFKLLDEEISLLKQQLENYKKQKQGLMQKLLTGQWRVK